MNGNNGERGWARPEGAGHYEERRGATFPGIAANREGEIPHSAAD